MKNIFCLAILSFILFSSCEEQMVMVPIFDPPVSDRVVLFEELTGVDCPNCPAGSAKFQELLDLFGDNMVGYGIHGLNQTTPIQGSQYDFRNQDNIDLENSFDFLGKPSAVINRKRFDDQNFWGITTIDLWQSYVESIFDEPTKMNVFLNTSYDSDSRLLEINVTGTALEDLADDVRLTVTLSESHIIDAQSNQGTAILDYEHNHVLREIITSVTGDVIGTNMTKNENFNKTFSFTLPTDQGLWIYENMEVIAFTTQITEGTEEVLQAAAEHF